MSTGHLIQWRDLFTMVDDGSLTTARYAPLEAAFREQAKAYPRGLALLCILPPEARPPPDDIKQLVKTMLTRLAASIACLAYVIEPTGFRGVAARATLVGMKIFSSRPYPIHVETSLRDALGKIRAHIDDAERFSVEAVAKLISDTRLGWKAPPPAGAPSQATAKS
jgi:hypothetical protein